MSSSKLGEIQKLVMTLAAGDPAKQMALLQLCRLCYEHVEEATKRSRLEILNMLTDPTPPDYPL